MREWIETNGLGGYASLTSALTNIRKYHGLLVASLQPPSQRWMVVENCVDSMEYNGNSYPISTMKGDFSFDLFPSIRYNIKDVYIKKTFFQVYEQNITGIRYDIKTKDPIMLYHQPILNSRHIYDLTPHGNAFHVAQQIFPKKVVIKPDNIEESLTISLDDASYRIDEQWHHMNYPIDAQRHDACQEYVLASGEFEKQVPRSLTYYLLFSLNKGCDNQCLSEDLFSQCSKRKESLLEVVDLPDQTRPLLLSSDRFIVQKGMWKTIIAGYHWFSDWGRDTLISLPGIALVTGRFEDARLILNGFNRFQRKGLIPNTFDDRTGEAAYNTVDASLWFIDRVFQYLKYTNDTDFLQVIYPTIQSIIEEYMHGTDFGIGMDDDFLISHGPGLTWMDVKLGESYPTPRSKKAVEIQALFYNALCIASICARYLRKSNNYEDLAKNVKRSFLSVYDKQYDVIDTKDATCRPNKVFLVSLDFSMIPFVMQKEIVENVEDELMTIFGLRTLSSNDDQYLGSYIGKFHRDLAYHNGTVWPWLMGPFITSFIKVNKRKKQWRQYAFDEYLAPMLHVFGGRWDGSIAEIFDGDPPFAPRGCMNQAWSVAEILRAWVEDILDKRPQFERMFQLNKIRI